jgi:hypothetical protein
MLFLPSRWLGGEKHGGPKKNPHWRFLLATLPGICRVLTGSIATILAVVPRSGAERPAYSHNPQKIEPE